MIYKTIANKFFKTLLILGTAAIAGAQTQPAERQSLPKPGNEKYWLVVDEFADRAVHLAYAKRFLQLHEGSLNDRQCQQYSRIAAHYEDQLAAVRRAGVSAESEFWNDVRVYSISMIGVSGVPIPVHRTGNYRLTTGSEAEDRELRGIVSLEIDEASSQRGPTGEYSPSAVNGECRNAAQEPTAKPLP